MVQDAHTQSDQKNKIRLLLDGAGQAHLQFMLAGILLSLWAQIALSVVLLVRLNQIYLLDTGATQVGLAQALGQPARIQNVSLVDAPTRGQVDVPVVIVEFGDFECPFCARHQAVLRQIETRYPDQVLIAFRHLPRQSNPETFISATAAVCAQRQDKFWEMHDLLFARQNASESQSIMDLAQSISLNMALFETCLQDDTTREQIERDIADARFYGIEATPSYLVNGRLIQGAISLEEFNKIIMQEIQGR